MPLSLRLLRFLVQLIEKAFSVRIIWADKRYRPYWLDDDQEGEDVGACYVQHQTMPVKKFSGECICRTCGRGLGEWV